MRFPRQEYWSGLSSPSTGDFPNPRIKPASLLGRWILNHWATWEAPHYPMTVGLIFLCLSLLLLTYLLWLLVAAKYLGWVFWKPSIIWHVLNFSSLSSHYSTTNVPLLQIGQILGPSPNTCIPCVSVPHLCPFCALLPGRRFLLFPEETVHYLKLTTVASPFTVISWTIPFRIDSLLVWIFWCSIRIKVFWSGVWVS